MPSAADLPAYFIGASWVEVALIGLTLNAVVTATSVVLWRLLAATPVPPTPNQWASAATTTIVNGLVLVPAWLLWRHGHIQLAAPSWRIGLEFVALVIWMDTFLYWTHRISHHRAVYRFVHERHHTDDEVMTPLTLFVMHPVEAAGFGVGLMLALLVIPVSVPAIVLFGGLNLMAGTLAHLPVGTRWTDLGGWTAFHQAHHEQPGTNFGFFVPIWDRVCGTAVQRPQV